MSEGGCTPVFVKASLCCKSVMKIAPDLRTNIINQIRKPETGSYLYTYYYMLSKLFVNDLLMLSWQQLLHPLHLCSSVSDSTE